MGVMTRKIDEHFVITSDRGSADATNKPAPKRMSETSLRVWTGDGWSAIATEAKIFTTPEAADEYTRANFARVMSAGGTTAEQ